MATNGITVELTDAQVQQVIRATGGDGLGRFLEGTRVRANLPDNEQLSRSLVRGLLILDALRDKPEPQAVTKVARDLGMGISTTHRYVSTLVECGLVVRDPKTRKYTVAR